MSHGLNIGPQLPPSFVTENLPNHFLSELTGHDGPVLAVRFNSNGNYCVSCGKVRHFPVGGSLLNLRSIIDFGVCGFEFAG